VTKDYNEAAFLCDLVFSNEVVTGFYLKR